MWKQGWSADCSCRRAAAAGMRSTRIAGLARMALDYGGVRLVGLDELDPDATVITATAVGAPGFANWAIKPRDAINAARRLIEKLDKPPVGVICGHVPGLQCLAGRRRARARLYRRRIERARPSDREDGRHGAGVAARPFDHADCAAAAARPKSRNSPLSPKATSSAPRM